MIKAQLTGPIVDVEGRVITDAEIMCNGTALIPTQGALIHEKDETVFVTNTQPDMETMLLIFSAFIDFVKAGAVPVDSGSWNSGMAAFKLQVDQLKATLI